MLGRTAGDEAVDVAKNVAKGTVGKTAEIAGEVAEKSKEVASAASADVSDGWITTKVKAQFADETVLKGTDINVNTNDYVVTLKGTVLSLAAKTRAAEIARRTERVTRVVNRLFVE
jgi:hyperosmotically inducible protein